MIDWVIDAVHGAGADAIKVVINPHHAELAAHLDGKVEVVYQREPRGTAHALQQVGGLAGDVVVVNGDSPLLTADTVRRVVDAHRLAKGPATLASVEDPTRDDGRIVRGKKGDFEKIVERKDASEELRTTVHEFNVGIYCFDAGRLKEALARVSDDNKAGEY
jgi:bifunctional UDP-N-acetylglucosamine pyrophosphorylase / glucosamine-1-phosphate N-acetyltransferase